MFSTHKFFLYAVCTLPIHYVAEVFITGFSCAYSVTGCELYAWTRNQPH